MASYRGHLMLSAPLGAAYGALVLTQPDPDWGTAVLAATLTTVGGLLPDLDSDSGVPVRELFGTLAALVSVVLFRICHRAEFTLEQSFALVTLGYFFVRYGLSALFKSVTVHRGMFHSIPATLIAGLVVYLTYPASDFRLKLYLAGGVALGFLSHLVLDEIYAVDINGLSIKTNQFSGTALKFGSPSWMATLLTYAILFGLGYLTVNEAPAWAREPGRWLAEWRRSYQGQRPSQAAPAGRALAGGTAP